MKLSFQKSLVIQAILRARLERDFAPGDRVPSEHALCAEFKVSRMTIQQALRRLEKEGLLAREQGRGTFYSGPPRPRTETEPSQLLETVISQLPVGFVRLVGSHLQAATARIAERLAISPGSEVVAINRVGVVDNEPIMFIRAYLPRELGQRLLEDQMALTRATLASLLHDTYGVEVDSVTQTVSATLADPEFADHLGVEVGAPVLEGERIYFDRAGRPVLWSRAFYRADRHHFTVTLKEWR